MSKVHFILIIVHTNFVKMLLDIYIKSQRRSKTSYSLLNIITHYGKLATYSHHYYMHLKLHTYQFFTVCLSLLGKDRIPQKFTSLLILKAQIEGPYFVEYLSRRIYYHITLRLLTSDLLQKTITAHTKKTSRVDY